MVEGSQTKKFLALNLLDVADLEKYLGYFSPSPEAAPQYGGRWMGFGRMPRHLTGDLAPRQVLLLVEWESEEAFNAFRNNPESADFHPLRDSGTTESHIWQTFAGLHMFDPDLFVDEKRSHTRTLAAVGCRDDMAQVLAGRPTRETTVRRTNPIHSREVTSRG